jgi:hypothetical protein
VTCKDLGMIDLATKTIQVGIIAFSTILLRDLKKHQVLPNSQLVTNKGDWKKQNVS